MNGWPILINVSRRSKCRSARVVGRKYRAKFLTAKDRQQLLADIEYWLLIEIQNTRWPKDAIQAALADVRNIMEDK